MTLMPIDLARVLVRRALESRSRYCSDLLLQLADAFVEANAYDADPNLVALASLCRGLAPIMDTTPTPVESPATTTAPASWHTASDALPPPPPAPCLLPIFQRDLLQLGTINGWRPLPETRRWLTDYARSIQDTIQEANRHG